MVRQATSTTHLSRSSAGRAVRRRVYILLYIYMGAVVDGGLLHRATRRRCLRYGFTCCVADDDWLRASRARVRTVPGRGWWTAAGAARLQLRWRCLSARLVGKSQGTRPPLARHRVRFVSSSLEKKVLPYTLHCLLDSVHSTLVSELRATSYRLPQDEPFLPLGETFIPWE